MSEGHPSDEVLEQYSLGRLPDAAAARIEEHLLICAVCQDRLAETDVYVRTIRCELREPAPSWWTEFLRGCGAWLARPLPAVSALAVLAVVWFWAAAGWRPSEPAAVIPLATLRGSAAVAAAPAGKPLALRLDTTGLPARESYRLEVVDAAGRPVLESALRSRSGTIALPHALGPGRYWVRLRESGGQAVLLREYGLQVGRPGR